MTDAWICEAVRSPIGRYGGALSSVRPDDLAASVIASLMARHSELDPYAVDDVIVGCANQAGEDNRNVARMATLLAGLPTSVPAVTVNRLCGSGMNAVGMAANAIQSGQAELLIAGGVESMSRAPFVVAKSDRAFARNAEMYDTTLGWRFVNKALEKLYGTDSMAQTAENVAAEFAVSRDDQDAFALRSQQKCAQAVSADRFADERVAITISDRRGKSHEVIDDEHPRPESTLSDLQKLKSIVTADGTVTAGNASGINDGACALLLASDGATKTHGLKPIAKVLSSASVGVEPRLMGMGPVPASNKALKLAGRSLSDMHVIELNEAFAAQCLAVQRELGLDDDDERVNPNGGAIALGHPLGMSGARLLTTAAYELKRSGRQYALCAMCIGVGQGIATVIEAA